MHRSPRLGDVLVEARLIDEFQLEAALGHQRRFGNRLGVALVRLGFLREDDLVAALARQLRLPVVRLAGKRIAEGVLALLPAALMEKHGCLPLFVRREGEEEVLYLGTADPCDRNVLDEVARAVGLPLRLVLVAPTDLHEAVSRLVQPPPEPGQEAGASPLRTMVAAEDTAPLLLSAPGEASGGSPTLVPGARPREVRTRVILHALTQLLVENGAIERGALVRRIQSLENPTD